SRITAGANGSYPAIRATLRAEAKPCTRGVIMGLAERTPPTVDEYLAYPARFSNWGRWGDDDELGTLNHITDETRRRAAGLVADGRTVSLSRAIDTFSGPA